MGYYTRITGRFTITPPLTLDDLQDSDFTPERGRRAGRDLEFFFLDEPVTTEMGTMLVRTAAALQPLSSPTKAYRIIEDVQDFLDSHPGHVLTGRLDCRGEEAGDLWRLEVHGGRAVKVTPRIVWPDGSEEPA